MIENGDIEKVEALVLKADHGHLPDSWLRIKKELEKLTQKTNSKSDAVALLRDMVKIWNVYGVIYKDSWFYERANAIIAQQHI